MNLARHFVVCCHYNALVPGMIILFIDSMRMEKHSASRKTALTRAPNTSARAHPNVFLLVDFFDIRTTEKINKEHVTDLQ